MKVLLFRVHTGDLLSEVIQDVTRADYTHAALLLVDDRLTICEAYIPEVRIRELRPEELPGIDVYSVDGLDNHIATTILGYCNEAVADKTRYSIANLFRFNPLFRKAIGETYDASVHDPVICSQFVFDALDRGGGIKLLNAPSFKLSPGNLAWSPFMHPDQPMKPAA